MSAMITRKRALLVTAALIMGLGAAAGAPAEALSAQPQMPAAVATVDSATHHVSPERTGWHVIWGPKTHSATKYWSTQDFVPDAHHLAVNYGCWGHEGAKIRAVIVRTQGKKVMVKGSYALCHDAAQHRLDLYNAQPGTSYYMRLYISGPKHAMWAKALDYHE